ncbi:hypothetical protein ACFL0U_02960 [Pseudomonadota bacterium]
MESKSLAIYHQSVATSLSVTAHIEASQFVIAQSNYAAEATSIEEVLMSQLFAASTQAIHLKSKSITAGESIVPSVYDEAHKVGESIAPSVYDEAHKTVSTVHSTKAVYSEAESIAKKIATLKSENRELKTQIASTQKDRGGRQA